MITTDHINIFKLQKESLDRIDEHLHPFLTEWKNKASIISTYTSGSTGIPKKIDIDKKHMIASAKATIDYFNLKEGNTFLICLPIKTIGGKMMLIRSLLLKGKIILIKPSKNPIENLNVNVDFCAVSPMQLTNCLKDKFKLNYIDKLIIGGAPISHSIIEALKPLKTKCYHTFGMTETISHIAIKQLNNTKKIGDFRCLNHVQISSNTKGNLIVKSNELGIKSITTSDIVEITGNKSFNWLGRADNIINSGGVKISPESIENELSKTLPIDTFFTTSISDLELGEKFILISKSKNKLPNILKAIQSISNNILRPKSIYIIDDFEYTLSSKINRPISKEIALKTNPFKI